MHYEPVHISPNGISNVEVPKNAIEYELSSPSFMNNIDQNLESHEKFETPGFNGLDEFQHRVQMLDSSQQYSFHVEPKKSIWDLTYWDMF